MIQPKSGDILLVNFPFTDQTGSKVRPAVVISRDDIHQKENDYTLLFISSVIPAQLEPYEILFQQTHPDFAVSGLKKDSLFKANKIVTVQRKLLKRRLGRLGPEIGISLRQALREAIVI